MQQKHYSLRLFMWQVTEKLSNWLKQGNLLAPITDKSMGLFTVWSRHDLVQGLVQFFCSSLSSICLQMLALVLSGPPKMTASSIYSGSIFTFKGSEKTNPGFRTIVQKSQVSV